MVVSIHPEEGWFYRINTKNVWRPAVPIKCGPEHPFLDHDSHIECGDPLMLDDYLVEQAIKKLGVIGTVSKALCEPMIEALNEARYLSEDDKTAIRTILQNC